VSIAKDTWDSTAEDLERARRELRQMESKPPHLIADEQAFMDKVANKRLFIARLERELEETS
jgi:hypothetical protein